MTHFFSETDTDIKTHKVFCINCKWYKNWSYFTCYHPSVRKLNKASIKEYYTYGACSNKNIDNQCQDWEPQGIFQSLSTSIDEKPERAFTLGFVLAFITVLIVLLFCDVR